MRHHDPKRMPYFFPIARCALKRILGEAFPRCTGTGQYALAHVDPVIQPLVFAELIEDVRTSAAAFGSGQP